MNIKAKEVGMKIRREFNWNTLEYSFPLLYFPVGFPQQLIEDYHL
jgi:hypothetical protein